MHLQPVHIDVTHTDIRNTWCYQETEEDRSYVVGALVQLVKGKLETATEKRNKNKSNHPARDQLVREKNQAHEIIANLAPNNNRVLRFFGSYAFAPLISLPEAAALENNSLSGN